MLRTAMPKKDTIPMQIRPLRETSNRLHKLAEAFKKESGNQVALEIIEEYLEFWVQAEQAKRDTITQQQLALQGAIKAALLTRPLRDAVTEKQSTSKAQKR
jgi:hypothetical protein